MTVSYVDVSESVAGGVQCLIRAGVKAVGRYYNYGSGKKVLSRQEAQELVNHGISIWVVFEYFNNKPQWFSEELGKKDGIRALQCAQEIVGQPLGTTIYFAADYDEDGSNYTSRVAPYFKAVRDVFKLPDGSMPYRIGVYSNGLVCRRLLDDKLAEDAWLACSRGYHEYAEFYALKKWAIAQTCGTAKVCGFDSDDDEIRSDGQFGQFDRLVPLITSHVAPIAAQFHSEFIANANIADSTEDDPAKPGPGGESETADAGLAGLLTNIGLGQDMAPVQVRAAGLAQNAPTTVALTIAAAQDFLKKCMTSNPRVTYGLGAKVPFHGAVPGADFRRVDCSGFVREALYCANSNLKFPDGSVVQHEWVRVHGFAQTDVASGKTSDNKVRIAFLRPQDTKSGIGHVVLIYNGKTLESHGGVGPDSRLWTGYGWQGIAYVYTLSA
jgi:hypothetical protein